MRASTSSQPGRQAVRDRTVGLVLDREDGPEPLRSKSHSLATPPLLVPDPLVDTRAGFALSVPGRPAVALRRGLNQVRRFPDGWRVEALVTAFHPVWLQVMRHETGEVGWWAVRDNGLVCSWPKELSEPERLSFRARLLPVAAWLEMIRDAAIRLPLPAEARALLEMPASARRVLLEAAAALEIRLQLDPVPDADDAPAPWAESAEEGRTISIRQGQYVLPVMADGAVASLGPGWHVDRLGLSMAPILLLLLRHDDHRRAIWFVDLQGRRIGHHPSALRPPHRDYALALLAPRLEALWQRFVLDRDVSVDDALALLGEVPPDDLATFVEAHLAACGLNAETRTWTLTEPPPQGVAFVAPTASGPRLLHPDRVLAGLRRSLCDENDRLIGTGEMRWPSPIDDRELASDGVALLVGRFTFAYRFHHPDGLCFYAICQGGYFKTAALYFPEADLLVAEDPLVLHEVVTIWGIFRRGRETMLSHVVRFALDITRGAMRLPDPHIQAFFGASGNHIGHYVWQELCGLAYMIERTADPARLPQQHLFADPRMTQYCGPIERIFPTLVGKVTRHALPFDPGLAEFYRRNQRVIRYTATTVPVSLGRAICEAADVEPSLHAERRRADELQRRADPIIVVGLRVGVRRMVDQDAFYAALFEKLKRLYPNCAVVLDGMNDLDDRGRAVDADPDPHVVEEFAIADGLARHAARLGIPLVDLVNRSTLCSVLWCSRADVFIAPLGAALAKYRWICNTPGMVVTSRWNIVERFDLHIYDFPEWMDEPTETIFNTADETTDIPRPGSAGTIDGQSDYRLDREPVFERFFSLVSRHRR